MLKLIECFRCGDLEDEDGITEWDDQSYCTHCFKLIKPKHCNVKLSLDTCKAYAQTKNGQCLSTEYVNSNTKMMWMCHLQHSWSTRFSHIKEGHWCPVCSGGAKNTIEDCREYAKSRKGKCLSKTYKNAHAPLKWQCKNLHTWKVSYHKVVNAKHWCRICNKLSIEDCHRIAAKHGGQCLSKKYKHSVKLLWSCVNHHRWRAMLRSIKRGSWCPGCLFKSETVARTVMEDIMNVPFYKANPPWLKGLQLDGYNEEEEMAFEYQGIQHYKTHERFHQGKNTLESQLKRDRAKARRCKRKGVLLVVIPYTYTHHDQDAMREFVEDEIYNQARLTKKGKAKA